MKPFVISILAATIALAGMSAMANELPKKHAKKARAPVESPALDRRVERAQTIFVGEGTRIYFIDHRYQEVPYIRALGEGAAKSALIAVKVVKVLNPASAELPAKILVPVETSKGDIFGDARSPYDELVERHIGKQSIWLGEVVVRNDYGDDRTGRKPLEDPLTFLQAWDSKKRPVANSLPITQLKNVESSIAKIKAESERRKAIPVTSPQRENDDKYLN